ncbi:MAG: XdhC family protein [Micromonosporaceae bacterium]
MKVFEALSRALEAGHAAVLVTVVAVDGDPPTRPGARLLVVDGRAAEGTLGCAEFDTAGLAVAADLPPGAQETGDRGTDDHGAGDHGAGDHGAGDQATLRRRIAAGHGTEQTVELFAERFAPRPGVIVLGSTPVAEAIAELAGTVGRRVVRLLDEGDPLRDLAEHPPGPRDAVVIADHDAPYAQQALELALRGEAYFVGMPGSKRLAPQVLDRLRAAGFTEDQVRRLRTPCGLDVGGKSPGEMALSIVAEVVADSYGRTGASLSAPARAAS